MKTTKAVIAALLSAAMVAGAADKAADNPLKEIEPHGEGSAPVLFIGDSMMKILGAQAEKEFKKAGVTPAVAFSSLGSGLVRKSVFNWNAKIDELIATNSPKMVFIALGTNDRQALETEDGIVNYTDAARWETEYAKLVGAVMDQFIAAKLDTVVWFLPPDMKDVAHQEHAALVRKIVIAEALKEERKDKVQVFDMAKVLSTRPGKYSQYKMSLTGEALSVRDPDGVHLAPAGGKLVAQELLKTYWGKK